MTARVLLLAAALSAVSVSIAACGGDASPESSTTPTTPTTVAGPVTTASPTKAIPGADAVQPTSTIPPVTPLVSDSMPPTSADAATTTSVAPAARLVLRADGLGEAVFGTDPDSVVAYMTALIGPPSSDSGWVTAPTSPFGVCPGTEVRGVTWGDLRLLFGDSSDVTLGRRHFFHYEYGPAASAAVVPVGMVSATGVGIGTALTQLFSTHPEAEVFPADEIGGPYFVLGDGLAGLLSGTESTAVVQLIAGGVGCGE